MIGKEEFTKLIKNHQEFESNIDNALKIFPYIFESPLISYAEQLFDKLLDNYFDDDSKDWIFYYLYENPEKCYYQDNKKIPLETIDNLWTLVKKQ